MKFREENHQTTHMEENGIKFFPETKKTNKQTYNKFSTLYSHTSHTNNQIILDNKV